MSPAKNIGVGDRFREANPSAFGTRRSVWAVSKLFTGTDSRDYANLFCVPIPSEQKTISINALSDTSRFVNADS